MFFPGHYLASSLLTSPYLYAWCNEDVQKAAVCCGEPSELENLASHADKVITTYELLSSLLINSVSQGLHCSREKSHPFLAMSAKTRHSVSRPSAWHRGPSVNKLVPLLSLNEALNRMIPLYKAVLGECSAN